ncbi:MAG: hypothetical protein ACXW00_13020, partial [Methylobacter sp.]
PNSEVKPFSADDSVARCHVKVGNRQALYPKTQDSNPWVFFCPGNRRAPEAWQGASSQSQ